MNRFLILIILLACYSNCKDSTSPEEINIGSNRYITEDIRRFLDTTNIVDDDSYLEYQVQLFNIDSTYYGRYLLDSMKAVHDIKKNHLVYDLNFCSYFPGRAELSNILKSKFNIHTTNRTISCSDDSIKFDGTYPRIMVEEIEKRYGEDFISEMQPNADSLYYLKTLDSIHYLDYHHPDEYPLGISTFLSYVDSLEKLAEGNLKYPKDYKFKNEQGYSFTVAEFRLNKNGSISDLDVYTSVQNPENKKYSEHFKSQIESFILNTKWKPVEIYGLKINSYQYFSVHHR